LWNIIVCKLFQLSFVEGSYSILLSPPSQPSFVLFDFALFLFLVFGNVRGLNCWKEWRILMLPFHHFSFCFISLCLFPFQNLSSPNVMQSKDIWFVLAYFYVECIVIMLTFLAVEEKTNKSYETNTGEEKVVVSCLA